MKSCMPRRAFCIRLICWLAHSETSIEGYPFRPKTVLHGSGMRPSAQHCRKLTMPMRSLTADRIRCLQPRWRKCAAVHLIYLDLNLAIKGEILAKTTPIDAKRKVAICLTMNC
jgi:hypothetical protein